MEIPVEIQNKFNTVFKEVENIIETANKNYKTKIPDTIRFQYEISAPRNVLTDFERAQSICFITRYDSLPEFTKGNIEEKNGFYYFDNYHDIRYLLNEYRCIIQNKKDSIYFQKINKFCRDKLLNEDHSKDLSIKVNHSEQGDITHNFLKFLDENCKVIRSLINQCEFDYLYNGILQHTDHKYTDRFLEEYTSGKINYVFTKHALIAQNIKILMRWYYRLFSALILPKLGPL
ncbi:MAG: hypothetical protein HRU03_09010 [Nanoarchaeales archaeon]|nr:hypothetical protein [Nanoarchaeales archaeon]